jgi:hypothetical protein
VSGVVGVKASAAALGLLQLETGTVVITHSTRIDCIYIIALGVPPRLIQTHNFPIITIIT